MSRSQLGVLAKHWLPGQVKTRLANEIGSKPAARFYLACLTALLDRCSNLADEHVLCYWPPDRLRSFEGIRPKGWTLEPQVDGDLGNRIEAFCEKSFAAGFQKVVLLGSDSPNLPRRHVERALEVLEENRLVLGPTEDGGYYLIGAYAKVPPIFAGMPWSTPELWSATIRQLDAMGWQRSVDFEILPTWYDVDELDDLKRLHRELLVEAIGDKVLTELREQLERALNL